jgi:CubicO group peptidase (beta-lactamase class C family)
MEQISPQVAEQMHRIETGLQSDAPLWSQEAKPATISERLARHGTPAASVALINGGAVEWAHGYGTVESGRAIPVTAETIFQAGSISKHVAMVGVLRLVQQGLLDLDTDVNHYLTSWRIPPNGSWQPSLTLRQLLAHTARLSYTWYRGFARGAPTPTLVQVLDGQPPANTPPVRVVLLPGSQFRYSGSHYSVIQQVMIDVTATTFPELMHTLVFEPLGMRNSSYDQAYPNARPETTAVGHHIGGAPVHGKWRIIVEMAGAGLWSTPTDLAQVAIALQQAYTGNSAAFLSQVLVQEALTPQRNADYGLGTRFWGKAAQRRFGHGGDTIGYTCRSVALLARSQGAVVMTNSADGNLVVNELLQVIEREYAWPASQPRRNLPAHAPVALDSYVGSYELREDYTIRVQRHQDRLDLHIPGQPPAPLQSSTIDVFFSDVVNSELRFTRAATGLITGLVVVQEDREQSASKKM